MRGIYGASLGVNGMVGQSRRDFLYLAAGAAGLLAFPALAEDLADLPTLERNYAEAVRSRDGYRIAVARIQLGISHRQAAFKGLENRAKALALFEAGAQKSQERFSKEGVMLAGQYWASTILEGDNREIRQNLKLVRQRLKAAQPLRGDGSQAISLASDGMHAAILDGDLRDAEKWLAYGLEGVPLMTVAEVNGVKQTIYPSLLLAWLDVFYRLAAQIACLRKKPQEMIRWLEAANLCSDAAATQQALDRVPDTQDAAANARKLAEGGLPVVHLLISRAGSGMVVTAKRGGKVSHSLHAVSGPNGTLDGKDMERLLWGFLFWEALLGGRLGGWNGAYSAMDKRGSHGSATFRRALPGLAERIWQNYGSSVHAALGAAGHGRDTRFAFIQPSLLAVMPIRIASYNGRHPFLDDRLMPQSVPTGAMMLQAASRQVGNAEARLVGMFNPTGDLVAADAELVMVATRFRRDHLSLFPPGSQPNALMAALASSNSDIFYLATHGKYETKVGSGLMLGGGQEINTELVAAYPGRLAGRLAVLSACETGLTGVLTSAQPTSLPSALIDKGMIGVIGSHWLVNDYSTGIMMPRMMAIVLKTDLHPAEALGDVQAWIAAASREDIVALLDAELQRQPEQLRAAVKPLRDWAGRLAPGTVPFSDPFYWGAMVYYGA